MTIDVTADKITSKKIYYFCPFCFTNKSKTKTFNSRYFKNGNIAINRIPTIHHHGNEFNKIVGNWSTHRTSHCSVNREDVEIHITDETERF